MVALSFLFYDSAAGDKQLGLLVACIFWVYVLSASPKALGSKARLALSVALPMGVLVYYKYAAFLLDSVGLHNLVPASRGAIPAGISFYVFHLASFAIDRFRGDIAVPPGRMGFACYVSFFPQLVAGPITRFKQVGENISRLADYSPSVHSIWGGIAMFVMGLGAKLLLADPLMIFLEPLLKSATTLDRVSGLYLILGYSFRIYFDFYGYSMMAMGLGMAFGVPLPKNFDRPYLSLNPREFWRRWHMTLSFWIRDYLYLPLGGNAHYYRNILIVFAACGLWHGAGWNFVVWGLYHGVLVVGYAWSRGVWDRLPSPVAQGLTFALVSLGWPLFALDLTTFAGMLGNLMTGAGAAAVQIDIEGWALLAVAALVTFAVDTDKLASPQPGRSFAWQQVLLALVTVASLPLIEGSKPFIYFQF
ncbi:MAG: hypothetical protein BGO92_01420 [Magnetospirillum sp. 64-120]|nr:MAG: hypothetical protein BGO92_01420 [Magnetospirillum sp. 64-120]